MLFPLDMAGLNEEKMRMRFIHDCARALLALSCLIEGGEGGERAHSLELYLVTALVPSDTACLASSPGSTRRTAVWISRDEMV